MTLNLNRPPTYIPREIEEREFEGEKGMTSQLLNLQGPSSSSRNHLMIAIRLKELSNDPETEFLKMSSLEKR